MLNQAPSRLEGSIEKIQEAIDFYKKEKMSFTVASIGRFCESKWDKPKTQSIRNSKKLMDIIKQAQAENIISSITESKSNDFIDTIEDETIKSYVFLLEEKLKISEKKNLDLKKAIRTSLPMDIDKLIENNLDMDRPIDLISINRIPSIDNNVNTGINLDDLMKTLNNQFLNKLGVDLSHSNGKIVNMTTGTVVYE